MLASPPQGTYTLSYALQATTGTGPIMIPRYSRPEMAVIWEPQTRFQIWLDIERHACEAQENLGVIPNGTAQALLERGKFEIDRIAAFLPGMLISVWLLILILNATLAQNFLSKIGYSKRPPPLYREIELPQWLTIGLALSILLSFASGVFAEIGRNSAPLLSIPFFLLGLTVIHTLSRRVSARGLVLVGADFLLVVVGWISAIIVLLGVLEQWVSLRSKFAQPKQNSGE